MTIIIRRPWTRQPPLPQRVDTTSTLGRSLLGAWGGSSSSLLVNAARPGMLTSTSGTQKPTNKGAGLGFDGSSSRFDGAFSGISATPFTLMCWARWDGAAGPTNGAVFGLTIGTGLTYVARLLIDASSTWGLQAYASGLNSQVSSGVTVTPGSWVHLAAIYKSDNDREMWINGVYAANDPIFSGIGLTAPTDVFFGYQPWGGGTPFNGCVLAPVVANKALSSREINAHKNTPWQLFAPRQIIIPTSTAAATAPTLSALSAINVTASSAQPRITYTF